MKKILFVLVVMGLVFSSGPVLAKDGFYIGGDLGIAVAPGLEIEAWDNDVSTRCDGFINNDGSGNHVVPPSAGDCNQSANKDDGFWTQQFNGGTGILAGASLGYRMGSFRGEAEYFYRGTTYDDLDDTIQFITPTGTTEFQGGKVGQELSVIEAGVDDVLSHNFFANLYYDYRSDSRFTPYVGVGLGFARVSLDFYNRWGRNPDPDAISTFDDTSGTDEQKDMLHRRLAGTTTIGRAKLSDTLFGYQVLAGVDYQVSEPVSIGLKFRWADFGEFEDGREWDQLRTHDSAVGPEAGSPRVRYSAMTQDIQFWGVSLNMKYQF